MNTINSIGAGDAVQRITSNPVAKGAGGEALSESPTRAADSVDISGVGHLIQSLKDNNIRTDKVAGVRAQIDAGTYEDDGKLNVAADKLLDDLSK